MLDYEDDLAKAIELSVASRCELNDYLIEHFNFIAT
jgi:hypothetical protein